jgi:hypothetical protein
MNVARCRFVLFGCALALAGLAAAQTGAQRIRGDVVALKGSQLEVKTLSGAVLTVKLADNVRVSARSASSLAAITSNTFLGTTAVPQADGTLIASEVHIFPESMRGTGEGHRPMDTEPGATMTNATVTNVAAASKGTVARSTMTNATVANVAAGGGSQRITLKYKDGEKVVLVGDKVPVVMVEPGDLAMLTPGAHVIVTATKGLDGALVSERVSVGKNGLVPPI